MWPLHYFESETFGILEIDHPASWTAIIVFICALLIEAAAIGWVRYHFAASRQMFKILWRKWGVGLLASVAAILVLDRSIFNLAVWIYFIPCIILPLTTAARIQREAAGPVKLQFMELLGMALGIAAIGAAAILFSLKRTLELVSLVVRIELVFSSVLHFMPDSPTEYVNLERPAV